MRLNVLENVGDIHQVLADGATFDLHDASEVLEVEHRTKVLEERCSDRSSY